MQLTSREDTHELDYWNVSVQNALTRLCEQTTGELSIGFSDRWAQTGLERGLSALPDALRARFVLTDDASSARYVLVNPTYALFSGYEPSADMVQAVAIRAYGRTIMQIYERAAAQ